MRPDGGAQWFLRYTLFGRRHEMGLGSFPDVTLKAARLEAEKWQAVVRDGKDAIKEPERQRREAESNLHILNDIARDAVESRKAELKGDGKAGRWFSPLELHVLPKLGKMPVSQIEQRDIRDTLATIWHNKADTARKAMNRLSICMRHAAALGLDVDLQATDKAKALLGKQRHFPKNIPAMNWRDVPALYQSLDGGSISELALRLLILTAVRSANVRKLHLDQIDDDIWTIPAEAMKGRVGATSDFRDLSLIDDPTTDIRCDGFSHCLFGFEGRFLGVQEGFDVGLDDKFDEANVLKTCELLAVLGPNIHIQQLAHRRFKLLHVDKVAAGQLDLAAQVTVLINFSPDRSFLLRRIPRRDHLIRQISEWESNT